MLINFDSNSSTPYFVGRIGEGSIMIQVLNGAGVWIGKSSQVLLNPRGPAGLYDGFFISPADGIVELKWTGDMWMNWPDRLSDVWVQVDYMGCL